MSLRRAHLLIHGSVQGVAFRANARAQANRLHLHGWVRNLSDGDVEALAEGLPEAVDEFVRWCHRGPPHAAVESVTRRDEAATGEFAAFLVLH